MSVLPCAARFFWWYIFVSVVVVCSCLSLSSYQCQAQTQNAPSFYTINAFNYTDKATFTLDIIHTAQWYGRIGPVTVNGSNVGTECTLAETKSNAAYCTSASGQSAGGIARLQTFISNARTSYQNNNQWSNNAGKPLLIDAGNLFFGGPVYNALQQAPYVNLVHLLGVDIMGMGLYEFIENSQKTRDWVDAINPSIPIVVSNIIAAGDEYLGSPRKGLDANNAQSESGRTTKFESYRVLNVSSNGGTDVIPVGFVGCLAENTNAAGAVDLKVTIDTDPEPSVRLSIQRLLHAFPSVNVIVMISSCSVDVNVRLARNIIELDVIIESGTHHSNNPADRGNGKYPKVINNNLGAQCLIVAAGAYGARVGHLAVQFDKQGNAIAWMGDTTVLTSSIPADPTALSLVTSYLSQTVDFENRVIGASLHDIEGDDCRYNDCAAGELTCDALLWYCKDCVIAFQNGGGYGATAGLFTAAKGGNVTVNDLYRLSRFSNTIATFYVTGAVLLQVLQVGLQLNSMMQVAGMRYAYNPDRDVPIAQRIVDVSIYSSFAKKYVPLAPTSLYKVASSDFLALGGGSHTELLNGGAQQLNRYGPLLREVYRQYIVENSPINGTTKADLLPCNNMTYVLNYTNGQIVWPNDGCRIVRSSGSQDLLKVCPTSSKYAMGDVVYDGMIAGVTVINSTIKTCSGLGTCANQKCTCAVATEGMYAGLTMIRGDDCSDVRREYKFSSAGGVVLILLAALVILLSILTAAFYAVYHSHRVVRASSPWFMHVSCVGTALAALSVIISLSPISDGICAAQYWTLAIGFGLTFGSLFAKTYRLYRIFNQRQIQLVSISNLQVLSIVMGVAAIEILILIIFQADSPLTVTGTLMNDEQAWSYALQCSSPRGASYAYALFAFNGLILVKGTQLSFALRHIDGTFNETKYLGMAIYNTVLVTLIVLPLVYIFHDTYPTFVMAFRSIFILYCASFVLLVVTIPKYFAIQRASTRKNVGKASTMSRAGTAGKSSNNTGTTTQSSVDSSQQTTTTDDNLPKIRTGDLATRTQILQELMSDMSDHRKLTRLDRHLANAKLHVQELERLRETVHAQTAKPKSRSRVNHEAAIERDQSRKNTQDHHTTATANTMASNGFSTTTDFLEQGEATNMFSNGKPLPPASFVPRSSSSNALESVSRAGTTSMSRLPPPIPISIPIPIPSYTTATGTTSPSRDMQATCTSVLNYAPSSSSPSTSMAFPRSSGVEMHPILTSASASANQNHIHTGSLSTNSSHVATAGHSKNRI